MQRNVPVILLSLFLLLTAGTAAMAQHGPGPKHGPGPEHKADQRVSGAVVDAADGSPLSGVTVTAKGTGVHTQTGSNGRFSLRVPGGRHIRLIFRRDGYRPVTKEIDGATSAVIVSMKPGD